MRIYLALTAVMVLWGFNVSIIKLLVEYLPPVTITAFRIMTAGVVVFIILGFMGLIRRPTLRESGFIVAGSLLSVVAHHYFIALGLERTTAANGGLILGLGPLLTAFLAMAILRQTPSVLRSIGFLLGAAGVSITVLTGSEGLAGMGLGDLYVFLSILSQALSFIVISKAARTLDPRLLTGYMLIIGSSILLLIGLRLEPGRITEFGDAPWFIWFAFIVSAIFATAVGHMTYNHMIGKVGVTETAIFLNLNTFFSLVGAAVILGEDLLPAHFAGFIFIVTGVLLGSGAAEELLRRRRRAGVKH
ncbi:DMT family transporter [Indiicoccus explosivorum]|uniref:DMT family transporter n=1 Tax=Indiicoccus explosivorum TaxID=1917864 RepID=UPI001F4EDBF5|nr:DMT family transporter [Indiicoccus explosivorum]